MPYSYRCRGCNAPPRSEAWRGRCPSCLGFWDPVRVGDGGAERVTAASLVAQAPIARIATGIRELDSTVLGGGLVPGCVYLLAGRKGSGKSTLSMEVVGAIARKGRPAIYASGEEAAVRVGEVARRQRVTNPHVEIIGDAHDLDAVLARCDEVKPVLLVLDSLQVLSAETCDAGEGSTAQCDAVAHTLQSYCLRTGMCAFLLCHMKKDGSDLAGPETVGHLVDAVFFLERENYESATRMLFAREKNRTASTNAAAYFVMDDDGYLSPTKPKSQLAI
ncbi:MAG: repair protein RadA [bacterium]|nr:repair protein RadA [bacterium]